MKRTTLPKKDLYRFSSLLIYGILFLWQPVFAAITIISGENQTMSAGADSEDIVFQVVDEQGNPNTGEIVNFSLVNQKGEAITEGGLTVYIAETDDNGQVSTRLKDTNIIDNYTITATLATDTTQHINTKIMIVSGVATQLTVLEGDNQTISAGKNSANILFQLTDASDNVVSGQVVNFKLITPTGNTSLNNLFTMNAISDINGKVTTRLEEPDIKGNYTVIATLSSNDAVTASTTVQVTEAIPELPSLGFGIAIDKDWKPVDTNVIFHGGISVNNGDFTQEMVLPISNDAIFIQGMIKVDNNHVGQPADIIMVVGYKLVNAEEIFIMLDSSKAVQLWDGNPDKLVSFMRIASLPATQIVNLYDGQFQEAGKLQIYFGYRLDNGVIVFNASQAINILIKE